MSHNLSRLGNFRCNQKSRFLLLWLLETLFLFVFTSFEGFRNPSDYVAWSGPIPVIPYIILVYVIGQRSKIKYRRAKETIHAAFTDLARKENPKMESVVVKELPHVEAYTIKNKIVLSSLMFRGYFSDKEIMGFLYHEIGHTRTRIYDWISYLTIPIWFVPPVMLVFLQSSILYLLFIVGGLFFSADIILFERIQRYIEFKADQFASEKLGPEIIASTLDKSASSQGRGYNCDTPTHPSIQRRISRIRIRSARYIASIGI